MEGTSVVHFFNKAIINKISKREIIPKPTQRINGIKLDEFNVKSTKKASKESVQTFANKECVAMLFLNVQACRSDYEL